ncbi:putative membrane protein insertion efficiency factor [Desulfatibacillum alkenivorans DSM 16219]|jgi:putative membrane protein insertion efficiency factor|uniref:Putative membrane protein insertion efficiency factor n=1 Tax=Desulfatibacillum alkenivorans DSM 16219 TaxID=1121393 RepID=A0A1M6DNS3_9BACT|nr:putative membrane protein insertion efficiency factor [Desulfatibacillum alkenivorans DSM 16219]
MEDLGGIRFSLDREAEKLSTDDMKTIALHTALIVILLLSAGPAVAGGDPMKGPKKAVKPAAVKHEDSVGEGFMITAYQEILSPVGGARCRMHPSCSRYGRQCFEEYGLLRGYIMTCDRLMRCGRDEIHLSPVLWVNGKKKCLDPVSENAFPSLHDEKCCANQYCQ